MAPEAIDVTRSPWVTFVSDGHIKTRCRYCLQYFTATAAPAATDSRSLGQDFPFNHFPWCEWLAKYYEG